MTKCRFSLFLFALIMVVTFSSLFSLNAKASEFEVVDTPLEVEGNEVNNGGISPYMINPYVQRSKLVSTGYSWGGYTRVSDNLKGAGTISTNRTRTFGVTYSNGRVPGVSLNASVSNALGYSFQVPKGKTGYIGYRVYYQNRTYNVCNRFDRTKNSCQSGWYKTVAKVPQYGQYALRY